MAASSVKSRKAKGRRLQEWVKNQLHACFPSLVEGDIRGAIMGETGADIKFSPEAEKLIPLRIECKNQEVYKTLYNTFDQANSHEGKGYPLVVLKMNRKNPLALLDAEDFFEILKGRKND